MMVQLISSTIISTIVCIRYTVSKTITRKISYFLSCRILQQ